MNRDDTRSIAGRGLDKRKSVRKTASDWPFAREQSYRDCCLSVSRGKKPQFPVARAIARSQPVASRERGFNEQGGLYQSPAIACSRRAAPLRYAWRARYGHGGGHNPCYLERCDPLVGN